MNRNIKISEMIEALKIHLESNGDSEIQSIGTSSGSNSSFIFHTKEAENYKDIYVKCTVSK
ncbi:hypothetical protein [Clostridium tagluense]|uniref:Uncharacterized protein n=1 Tax=Clostridium tagluense TaxID=360422 RepID=A0A401USV7_9CLOT|nr:hypothetical protein [Clostridium tagluense]GCD12640.1 hypothetical protein Ctaglu_42630 [Clostridium tagluense]